MELEKQFYTQIYNLIKNILIESPNHKGRYYLDQSKDDLLRDAKMKAQLILDKMEQTKHLIGLD